MGLEVVLVRVRAAHNEAEICDEIIHCDLLSVNGKFCAHNNMLTLSQHNKMPRVIVKGQKFKWLPLLCILLVTI